MSSMSNMFGGASSVAPSISVDGNGVVFHKDGTLYAHELYASDPLIVTDPDGLAGPPRFNVRPGHMQIGALIGANGAITTDQEIPIKGAAEYVIDTILIRNSTGVPGAMTGGLFASAGKAASSVILPASQKYIGLTGDPYNVLKLAPPDVALRSASSLYFSLTTANEVPISFDILVYGLVTKPLEI